MGWIGMATDRIYSDPNPTRLSIWPTHTKHGAGRIAPFAIRQAKKKKKIASSDFT